MSLYLSPYVGLGTQDTPFFPRGLDEPGASAIDLRHDCTTRDGSGMRYALLWLPDDIPAPIGAKKLASDHGEPASKVAKQHCDGLRCHIDFSKDKTIEDVVSTLLLRPAKGHWGGLRPYKGVVEAWLGSSIGLRRWVHLPQLAGMTTATDNFNRADVNPIAGNWTDAGAGSSAYKIVSNQLVTNNVGGEQYIYWNADTFSSDQFSQVQLITVNGSIGVTVRGSGSSKDYYAIQDFNGLDIFKFVSTTYTHLGGDAGYTWPANDYIRLVAQGTTITAYADASAPPTTQKGQVTDTTFSGGHPGIYNFNSTGAIYDNWSGGDLGPNELDVTGSGGVTLGGSAPIEFTLIHTPSGGVTFAGTAPIANGKVLVGSGGIRFSGTAVVLKNGVAIAIRRAFRASRWFRNQ
jgi:hypothetical protein